jgi:type I restriction enzyme S subunit
MVTLAEVADISGGITKNAKRSALPIQRPYLSVANVHFNRIDTDNLSSIGVSEAEIARAELKEGDLMVVEGNGSLSQLGRVALWQGQVSGCLHQNHLIKVRPKPIVRSKWLLYWLMSTEGRKAIEAVASSTSGLHTLSLSKVGSLPAPITSLEEQQSAISYIELHLSRLDETVTTLQGIQAKLKQARASILKAAVEGRLVETEAECLSAQRPHYAQVQVLVKKLEDERQSRSIKGNKKGHGTVKTDSLNPEIEGRFLVPNGWTRVAVNELCWDSGYGTSVKCYPESDGDPVLRIPNVAKGKLDLTDLKKTAQRGALADDEMVAPGDFLFVRTNGSMSILGKGCAIVSEPAFPMSYASYLIRLRLLGPNAIWKWFELVWNSSLVRRKIEASAASSAGQNNISLSKVLSFELPLPPEKEIHQILELVDQRFSILDQVEATVQASISRCGMLRQAILKRAFEGRLVPAA